MATHRRAGWVVAAFAVVLVGIVGIRIFGQGWLHRLVVREIGRAVAPANVTIASFEMSLAPFGATLEGIELSEEGSVPLRVARLRFLLRPLESLWEGAWIGDLEVEKPEISYDPGSALWRLLSGPRTEATGGATEPAVDLRQVIVRDGRAVASLGAFGVAKLEGWTLEGSLRLAGGAAIETAGRLRVERAGKGLDVPEAKLRMRWSGRRLEVEGLHVASAAGTLDADLALEDRALSGHVVWNPVLEPLFALFPEGPPVGGAGRIDARLGGTTEEPAVEAELTARDVAIANVRFSGRGKLASRGWSWTLEPAAAEIFAGHAEGSARGEWTHGIPFTVQGRFRDWDPAVFVALFGPHTPLRGAWSGEAELSGHLIEDDLRGGGRFTLAADGKEVSGNATFAVRKEHVEVEGRVKGGEATEASCRYAAKRGHLSGEVEAKSDALERLGGFVGLAITGAGRGTARFSGTIEEPVFAGSVEVAPLSVAGAELESLRGPFSISRHGLDTEGLSTGRMRLDGRVALTASQTNDWHLRATGTPLGPIVRLAEHVNAAVPEATGTLGGEINAKGLWSDLTVAARLEATDTRIFDEELGRVGADVARDERGWKITANARREDAASVDLDAAVAQSGALAGRLSARGWHLERVATLRRVLPAAEGEVSLEARLDGTVGAPAGEAELVSSGLRVADQPLGQGHFTARLVGERLEVEGRIAEHLEVSARATVAAPHAYEARIRASELELRPYPDDRERLVLRLGGEGTLSGDAEVPLGRGHLRLQPLVIRFGTDELTAAEPVAIEIERGEMRLAESTLEGSQGRLVVSGRTSREGARFSLRGRADLSVLEGLSAEVASARGETTAELELTRGVDAVWRWHGALRVSGGAVDLAFLVGLTQLDGEIALEDRRVELRGVTGQIGGGDFLVAGTVSLDHGFDVGWSLHEANLGVPSWLDYRAAGRGRLVGAWNAPRLEGDIEITRAVYDRRIEWAEFLPWFRRETVRTRARALPATVALHIVADEGLFVDNNLAEAELRADLRLRGEGQRLTWSGRIDVVDGALIFRRRRFTINSGTVQFSDDRPSDPDIELDGETQVTTRDADYRIQLRVGGSAATPRIQFTADDSTLTENDVLALVTFGRTVAQLQSQGAAFELDELGQFLSLTTGPQAGEMEERLYGFLSVDRIEIEPSFSRTSGTSEPRLSIAKDLTERFSAVLGTGLGAERRQDAGVEYRLTRRISLQGQWESESKSEAGAFGGDVKFRIPLRGIGPYSLLSSLLEGVRAP